MNEVGGQNRQILGEICEFDLLFLCSRPQNSGTVAEISLTAVVSRSDRHAGLSVTAPCIIPNLRRRISPTLPVLRLSFLEAQLRRKVSSFPASGRRILVSFLSPKSYIVPPWKWCRPRITSYLWGKRMFLWKEIMLLWWDGGRRQVFENNSKFWDIFENIKLFVVKIGACLERSGPIGPRSIKCFLWSYRSGDHCSLG